MLLYRHALKTYLRKRGSWAVPYVVSPVLWQNMVEDACAPSTDTSATRPPHTPPRKSVECGGGCCVSPTVLLLHTPLRWSVLEASRSLSTSLTDRDRTCCGRRAHGLTTPQ